MALTKVTTGGITDATIATADIAADAVTGAKIADDAVGAEHIEVLDSHLQLTDNSNIKLGTGDDLLIYHNGSDSYVKNSTGDLYIRDTDGNVYIQPKTDENAIKCVADGQVELYYDNSKKAFTGSTGFNVSGNCDLVNDNDKLQLGNDADLQIYHDGTTNIIEGLNGNMSIRPKTGENGILIRNNGSVDLYHDDVKQCETSADGLAFPSGKGISFAATSDYTGDGSGTPSELLDDYEEGTFTPRFQTSNGNWGGSMSSQNGSYTKIGNVVHVTFRLHWGSVSGTGNFRITALPFTVANVSSNQGGPVIGVRSGFNYPRLTSYWMNNNQQLQFQYVDSSGSMGSFDLGVGAIASTGYVYCSGWYETA